MAWTQDDLDAINTALSSGAKRVRFQTHEVEYQSVTEMLKVRDLIIQELQSASRPVDRAIYAEYESGY
ncbi:hypothetical protein H4S14_000795 [Agrobacterium vitis]|nr:hypothetical protein [Agrobacterium vitis]MBE1437068.1 hypothetical protein [Agrobacterium vitis]